MSGIIICASSRLSFVTANIEFLFGDDRVIDLWDWKDSPVERRVYIETPKPPRLVNDRPAWQTKYGPPQRGRK